MFFHDKSSYRDGVFSVPGNVQATAHTCLQAPVLQDLFRSFSFHLSALSVTNTQELCFRIGHAPIPSTDGCAYAIAVTPQGVSVCAGTEQDLIHGYITLLDMIRAGETGAELPCCEIREKPLIEKRMVHFCIFPETALWELEKFVRFCGALKYTHIILEFWGMLQYDCLQELAWPHAFQKEEIAPIIETARALGMQVIPMFNHWGHASASRIMHGKHVVLDQNPALQAYFTDTGWCWDIRREKTRALLRAIRAELIELCGEGDYFHIGCDEAYGFTYSHEEMDFICDFLNEVSGELAAAGRRAIAWGDMLVYNRPSFQSRYYAAAAPSEACEEYLLSRLDRRIIIADWQYHAMTVPIETALIFREAGFDCLLCPWEKPDACLRTISQEGLYGLLHTTWHTLSAMMPQVAKSAQYGWQEQPDSGATLSAKSAALLRKAFPANGQYEQAGWAKHQIGVIT